MSSPWVLFTNPRLLSVLLYSAKPPTAVLNEVP
jgi:hypothetical protein